MSQVKEFPIAADGYLIGSNCQNLDSIVNKIVQFSPVLIGYSLPLGTFSSFNYLFPLLQKKLRNALHIAGGATPTHIPSLFKGYHNCLIVIGEGEEPFYWCTKMLNNGLSENQIRNRYPFRQKTYQSAKASFLSSDYCRETQALLWIESSRYCTSACSFCSQSKLQFPRVEFPVSAVGNEINEISSNSIDSIQFCDEDLYGGNFQRFNLLVDQIMANGSPDWKCDLKPIDVVKLNKKSGAKIWPKLKTSNLRLIFLGVESGSDSQLRRYRKPHSAKQAIQAIKILRKNNIPFAIGFIMFDPYVTESEILKNINFIRKIQLHCEIPSPLKRIRMQHGTLYADRLFERKLLNSEDLDPDELSFNWNFINYKILKRFSCLDKYWEKFYSFDYHVKWFLFGSKFPDNEYFELRRFLHGLIEQELYFLEKLIHKKVTIAEFVKQRSVFIESFLPWFEKKGFDHLCEQAFGQLSIINQDRQSNLEQHSKKSHYSLLQYVSPIGK